MFPEIEIGSRPFGLFWLLLLRVVVQGVLGSTKTNMAGQRNSGAAWQWCSGAAVQRNNGVKEQRRSGATERLSSSKMVVLYSKRCGKDVASWKVAEYDFRTCQYGSLCHSVPMTIGSGPERPEYYIILCLAQTGEAEGKQRFWVFQAGTAER